MDSPLTVIIPAYNESGALTKFIPQLIDHCKERHWKIIIVDDGSTDNSQEVLERLTLYPYLQVLRHKVNCGYGRALKTGIREADTRFVVTIDADGQHRVTDIDNLFQALLNADADMVIGTRLNQKFDLYRKIGKYLIRKLAAFLFSINIRDLNSGFKLYNTGLLKKYAYLCPDSMAFSDIIALVFISRRHKVLEHPIEVNPRIGRKSTINTYTAFDTIYEILNIIMLFKPIRVFMPLAFVCFLAGFLWGLPIILKGRGISVGAFLAFSTGLIFIAIGLIAQQLSYMRQETIDKEKRQPND